MTGSALDHAIGSNVGLGSTFGDIVSSAISAVETLTLAPIIIGESLASTTLVAANSSLSVLQAVLPGSNEASFSLTSFVTLVRREWNDDMNDDTSPAERYGVTDVMKALVAWVILQGKTSAWQEQRWFKHLKEIRLNEENPATAIPNRERRSSIHVTRGVAASNQIFTADIGEAVHRSPGDAIPPSIDAHGSITDLKTTLRRFSKLVLAGYGGASLVFFGVPPVPLASLGATKTEDEEAQLTMAIDSSEAEASGTVSNVTAADTSVQRDSLSYPWWDVLLGKHDGDILLQYAASQAQPMNQSGKVHLVLFIPM